MYPSWYWDVEIQRKEHRIRQAELADKVGLSRSHFNKVMTGKVNATHGSEARIKAALAELIAEREAEKK